MITTGGKLHIKRYMAGFVPAVAQSIAFGISNTAVNVSDAKLRFEIGRVDIALTSLDLINNKVVYKAALPEDISGVIYEAGIYSVSSDTAAGQYNSKLISTFDSNSEDWIGSDLSVPVFSTTNARIGGDSLRHSPAAGTSETDVLNQIAFDLSGYSGNDLFVFAFNVGTAFTSSVRFRFMTDASNYYDFNLGAQTAGYKFVELAKSTAVATGAPNWENITSIQVTTSSVGGASQVDFDGIRIEDVDTINPEYVLVSRELLVSPFVKEEGKIQEIEFSLNITV